MKNTVRPRPEAGSGSELNSEQHQAGTGTHVGAVVRRPRRPARRRAGCQRRGTCLASIAAMLRTLNPESKVRFLGGVRGEVVRLDEDTVLKTAGGESRLGVRVPLPPPSSVGPAGVDARLSSGRSRVRVPYGARRGGCWWPIRTFNPGRAGSIPVHGSMPRWSSGRMPGSQPGEGGFDSRTRYRCSRGGIGIRAGLKPRCLRACGFDSHREHARPGGSRDWQM